MKTAIIEQCKLFSNHTFKVKISWIMRFVNSESFSIQRHVGLLWLPDKLTKATQWQFSVTNCTLKADADMCMRVDCGLPGLRAVARAAWLLGCWAAGPPGRQTVAGPRACFQQNHPYSPPPSTTSPPSSPRERRRRRVLTSVLTNRNSMKCWHWKKKKREKKTALKHDCELV